jgi:hypothetical protein
MNVNQSIIPGQTIMRIAELNQNQKDHHNTEITVAGVVRVTYPKPFPYLLLEDESGTLICRPSGNLPSPGAHVEITGQFVLETPENCTVEIAALKETKRAYVVHPTDSCNLATCEFATQVAA